MAKLSHAKIVEEVTAKGYTLIDDSSYVNLQSTIIIRCPQGHLIQTTLADFRHPSFECPSCSHQTVSKYIDAVPSKKEGVYRIIAFDQATEKFGLSIFDNGQLVFYRLYNFNGSVIKRLTDIKNFIENIVIKEWKPDFIIAEDIQYQNSIITYKILAALWGVISVICNEKQIQYEIVSPNVWRKYAGTCGASRREEKLLSIAKVKEKFGITVTDDVAESILIGNYAVKTHYKTAIAWGFGTRGI